jgi:enterochelin esterase-like enzyme
MFISIVAAAALAIAGGVAPAVTVHAGTLDVHHIFSKKLGATRTLRVWMPPGFDRHTRYSVLYLNDGQNLFGDGDPESGGGGWRADTAAADLMVGRRITPLLIVGIDNEGDRGRAIDYLPVPDPFDPAPAPSGADAYLDFLIGEVIPFVDEHYPTLRGPEYRGFGGSSYGAVSAF